jgi:hypothetical protein
VIAAPISLNQEGAAEMFNGKQKQKQNDKKAKALAIKKDARDKAKKEKPHAKAKG